MGISRSSTITCAFLMSKRGMTAAEALTQLRKHRHIRPNEGFLDQIVEYDEELFKKRNGP